MQAADEWHQNMTKATRPAGPSGPSAAAASPWLGLAAKCTAASAAVAAALAVGGLVASGTGAAASVAFAAAVVIAFFALSLLAGHIAGRRNPSGAIGVFAVVYVLKIVGFAALLLWIGTPAWVDGPWFGASGIVTVVVWQAVEVLAFSRLRLQIFDDEPARNSGTEESRG
jgi:ATP synthase protein I